MPDSPVPADFGGAIDDARLLTVSDFQVAADTLADHPALHGLLSADGPAGIVAAVNVLHTDGLIREALTFLAVLHHDLIDHLAAARDEDPDRVRAVVATVPARVHQRRRAAGRTEPAAAPATRQ